MKKNVIKFLILILLFGGVYLVTGCNDGANQFDYPDDPTENPSEPSDPVKPDDPDEPETPTDTEYYSKGFTIYELKDAEGNPIDGYAVGEYEGKDTEVIIPSTWNEKPIIKITLYMILLNFRPNVYFLLQNIVSFDTEKCKNSPNLVYNIEKAAYAWLFA